MGHREGTRGSDKTASGRTALIISHREQPIAMADQTLLLNQGRLGEMVNA